MTEPPLVRIPSRSWLRITLLIVATTALVVATVALVATAIAVSLLLLLPAALILATFWMLMLRSWTIGTYASTRGVAVQRLFGTHMVRWPEVSGVDDVGGTVVLALGDGQSLSTHIAQRSVDMVGSRARYASAKAELERVGIQA